MIKFGTDGWRAIIAKDFTFENVSIVAQAIADYLKKNKKGIKKIVIGYDCRFLSKEFAQTVACVLAANGIKVVLSDTFVPTPTISWHCRYNKYDLGVVITASHNPASYNGIKIKTREGGSADKDITDAVEKLLYKSKVKIIDEAIAIKDKKIVLNDLTAEHVKFLKTYINLNKVRKHKMRVLIDTMHGSGVGMAEKILGKSNLKIDYIHNEVNPSFNDINPEPVESNVQELIKTVKEKNYDLGVALDGDADRIAVVDSRGNYINAQVLVPLLALHMVKNRKVPGGIGKTVVGSNVIDKVALDLDVACYETGIGFKYISALFKQNLICIGGEEAGGIGFEGYIPERDGVVSFLLLLEMLAYENKKFTNLLDEFFKKYGKWHYAKDAIPVKSIKRGLDSIKLPTLLFGKKVVRVNTLDGIKVITKDSWLMFRKSGTEPIVRVYAESKSLKEAQKLVALGTKMVYAL